MKKVEPGERRVANIFEAEYVPFELENGEGAAGSVLQLNDEQRPGVGFHVYRMEPGCHTTPHEHTDHEEFLVIQGEAVDNDGTVYRPGDLVFMKKGTEHSTYTEKGCLMAVYIKTPETVVAE